MTSQEAENQNREDEEAKAMHREEEKAEHQGDEDVEHQGDEDAEHQGDEDAEHQGDEDAEHQGDEDAERQGDEDAQHQGDEDAERQGDEDAEHLEKEASKHHKEENAERKEEDDMKHREAEFVKRHEDSDNRKQLEHKKEQDIKLPTMKVEVREAFQDDDNSEEKKCNEFQQSDSTPTWQQSKQLPPLRSYVLSKRSGKTGRQDQQKLAPNRVMMEAAQLLPKLRHSRPGIGYYGRVRGQAANRSVDLRSSHEPAGQTAPLVLGPSQELTSQFYSSNNKVGQQVGVKRVTTAASVNGRYPFSRIIYPNLIGQSVGQPIRMAQRQQRSLTMHSSEGTFVLRHKLRQSAGCLARIMDSSSTGEAAVRRAISRASKY
ncbi:hypothetical protein BOX15_Mlig000178g1 [Macrostomum lignano]|uniref:Uncharacterized protein n=2 Tax=Macrostomum lignano TaxID=282301 RepID=A0A267EY23_9PLAT|nr:hypothetical protein BOX15_Mlig000178g4 [Macrostomum lignano]PAA65632.1 hypothetical protein BOX15_Mlig000178g1 [Macrostomum lignano]